VKVLDFGLAKAFDPTPEGDPSQSPTMTAATQMGVILGTAAYMSPEQARGRPVDKRTDIWAFGAVLYEMLTGRRAFDAEDISGVLADVIRSEVSWDALPDGLPPLLVAYLRRCLEKDPSQRVRDIGDVRLALAGAFETAVPRGAGTTVPAIPFWRRPVAVAAITLFAAAGTGLIVWALTRSGPSAPRAITRSTITLPVGDTLAGVPRTVVLSPDGTTLVYVGVRDGTPQLYRRRLDRLGAEPIPGTDGAFSVFFSPDGEIIVRIRPPRVNVTPVLGPRPPRDRRICPGHERIAGQHRAVRCQSVRTEGRGQGEIGHRGARLVG